MGVLIGYESSSAHGGSARNILHPRFLNNLVVPHINRVKYDVVHSKIRTRSLGKEIEKQNKKQKLRLSSIPQTVFYKNGMICQERTSFVTFRN